MSASQERVAKCGECVFFQDTPNRQEGQCRIDAPRVHFVPMATVQGTGLMPVSIFPTVEKSAWCGQFVGFEADPTDPPAQIATA